MSIKAIDKAARLLVLCLPVILAACAGHQGRPDVVQAKLKAKFVGQPLDKAVLELGAPSSGIKLDSGRTAYTWIRQTSEFANNRMIKSAERCAVTMMTDPTGKNIEMIGKVDDSLGAWQLSYCAEHINLD